MTAFRKMHGLGNDFVVLDDRDGSIALERGQARALADRRRGVGADQIIVMSNARGADCGMDIFNADGSRSEACGNASRCIASLLIAETGRDQVTILAGDRQLTCLRDGDEIAVNMGSPRFGWQSIPLAEERDTEALSLTYPGLPKGVAVNVGNPHVIFFLERLKAADIATLGDEIGRDPLFPQGVNVSFAEVIVPDRISIRVWERGTGLTAACGTAAIACLAAAAKTGRTGREAVISQSGGNLGVRWASNNDLWMTGPYALSFTGDVDLDAIEGGGWS